MRLKIFLITSKEECLCPCCGGRLKYRDHRLRIHKVAGGGKEWYRIRRLKCTDGRCGRLHNELPDCMFPYKHYDTGLIEDAADGIVRADDLETEDYPCEGTIRHWKWRVRMNEENMEGQMRPAAHRFLDMLEELRFLLNHEFDSSSPVSLVLVGQAELWEQKLRLQAYTAIRRRIDMNIVLGRLGRAETGKYTAAHLASSGAGKEIFTSGAEDGVYKISAGIPRMINRVCEKTLMYACQQQKRLADERMVRFVADHEMLGGAG